MGEIINLNRARKRRGKEDAKAAAAENRARHGMSKAERERAAGLKADIDRTLDGARRED